MNEINRLSEIHREIKFIFSDIVSEPAYPTDYDRKSFLFSELDSLMTVLDILQHKRYKESFILIRTVFEKFLYFWLMFYGRKYRHPMTYNIERNTSKTDREARDSTLNLWRKLWKDGDKNFREVISMDPGKSDKVIKVVYEFEGLPITRNGVQTEELLPIYNTILEQYNPNTAHIGNLPLIGSNILTGQKTMEKISLQKTIYNNFFYIDNLFRNLQINNLIDKKQLGMLKIHYNFLSKYVHVGMDNLKIWKECNDSYNQQRTYSNEIYETVIRLYVTKLFHSYLKIYVTGYTLDSNKPKIEKYETILEELETLSIDFWFIDNEPTEFDIKNSEYLKGIHKSVREKENPNTDILYYDNPLERMKLLISYRTK